MKNTFLTIIILQLLLIHLSCSEIQNTYYISEKGNFFNTDYTLAKKEGDSLKIWFIRENINAGFGKHKDDEIIPLRPGNYKNITIKEIRENSIVTNDQTLRPARNLSRFHNIRNEVTVQIIEQNFHDSVSPLYTTYFGNDYFLHLIINEDKKRELISTTHSDSFTRTYKNYLNKNFAYVPKEIETKKQLYSNITSGRTPANEKVFSDFMIEKSCIYLLLKNPSFILEI